MGMETYPTFPYNLNSWIKGAIMNRVVQIAASGIIATMLAVGITACGGKQEADSSANTQTDTSALSQDGNTQTKASSITDGPTVRAKIDEALATSYKNVTCECSTETTTTLGQLQSNGSSKTEVKIDATSNPHRYYTSYDVPGEDGQPIPLEVYIQGDDAVVIQGEDSIGVNVAGNSMQALVTRPGLYLDATWVDALLDHAQSWQMEVKDNETKAAAMIEPQAVVDLGLFDTSTWPLNAEAQLAALSFTIDESNHITNATISVGVTGSGAQMILNLVNSYQDYDSTDLAPTPEPKYLAELPEE